MSTIGQFSIGIKKVDGVPRSNYSGCKLLLEEDGLLNARLMEEMMAPLSQERIDNVRKEAGPEAGDELISRNWEQQLFFARSMMAMQGALPRVLFSLINLLREQR